jgi:hypothetical protein
MPEETREMNILGVSRKVTDVPISKATEFFNDYELADGSVLRVKSVVTAVLRVEGQFNSEGRPIYLVVTSPNTYVVTSTIQGPPVSPFAEKKQ